MALRTDYINSKYNALKMVSQKEADKYIDSLSPNDYSAFELRRDNERSIPDQLKAGLLKGITPSHMDEQVGDRNLSPTTLEQAMELGTETGKVISEGGAMEAGAGAGMALGSIPVVGGATAGGLLGAKYGEMAGNALGGHPLIGGAIGAGLGGVAGALIPGAGPIMGGIYGAGKGGELAKRAEDYAGIKAGEAAGLDTTGAAEQSDKEANLNFLLGSGAKTVGLGAKKILATNAAKDILRNAAAMGETFTNKVYTKIAETPVGKAAIGLVDNTRDEAEKLRDAARGAFDKINGNFNRTGVKPPKEKLNFLKGKSDSVPNSVDISEEVLTLPKGKVRSAALKVTGANQARFRQISGMTPEDAGYKSAYKEYQVKALKNATDKEAEAIRRYTGDAFEAEKTNTGLKADYGKATKNLRAKVENTRFKQPLEQWEEMSTATGSKGASSADNMFNELTDNTIPSRDKEAAFSDYLFGKDRMPTDSAKKIKDLNRNDPGFSRNFLKNSVRKLAHDTRPQNGPFVEALGDTTPLMKKNAAAIVNKFGISTNKSLDNLPILSDPESMKLLKSLDNVDLKLTHSGNDIINFNAEALNSTIRSPEWGDRMIAAGVKPKDLARVRRLAQQGADAQGAQKSIEKTLQTASFVTSVGKQIGGKLPIKLTPAQALKAARIAEHAAAPTANFLKSAVFENK